MRQMTTAGMTGAMLTGALLTGWCLPAPLLAHPGSGIVVDRRGQVYFVDTGSGLWKLDSRGVLARIATPRYHWMALDGDDRFGQTRLPSGPAGDITRVGASPTLLLASDYPLVIAGDGNLYYPSRHPDGAALDIVRFSPAGRSTVLASVPLPYLNGLAAAPDGSLYFTEDRAVHRVSPDGKVSTFASRVTPSGCARVPGNDPGDPLLRGLAVDAGGTVYVAASGCGSVLKIAPDGQVTTVLQLAAPWSPTAVALFGGDIYVLEYLHTEVEDRLQWVPRVRRILPDGRNEIIATVTR